MAELTDLERLVAEQACTRLVNAYALASDRSDYRTLADMYAEDGVFARPTVPDKLIEGREAIYQGFLARPPMTIRHVMANVVIDVQSASEATGESYIVMFRGPPGEGWQLPAMNPVALVGQFKDSFVKRDGKWLFKARMGSLAYAAS